MNIFPSTTVSTTVFQAPPIEPTPIEEPTVIDPDEVDGDEVAGDEPRKKPGVLRLLESGHFRGVSELRHRIRFHDELQARADEEAARAFNEGAEDLVDALNAGVETLVASLIEQGETGDVGGDEGVEGLVGEGSIESSETTSSIEESTESLLADFKMAVKDSTSADDSNSSFDLAEASAELQAAYDTLVGGLRDLFETTESEPVSGDPLEPGEPIRIGDDPFVPVAIETDSEPTLLDAAIAELTATFEQALSDLLAFAEQASPLPDPQPAPGHGAAFGKFLAIYDSLRYGDTTLDATA